MPGPTRRGEGIPRDNPAASLFETRLRRETRGDVLCDALSRGRYANAAETVIPALVCREHAARRLLEFFVY